MSKKAREAKKLRRKMLAEYKSARNYYQMDDCLHNLLSIGVCGIIEDKDGNPRAATIEEIEDVMSKGQIIYQDHISFKELTRKFVKPRKLTYNVLSMIYEKRR